MAAMKVQGGKMVPITKKPNKAEWVWRERVLPQVAKLEEEIKRMGLTGGGGRGALYAPDHAFGIAAASTAEEVARSINAVSPSALTQSLEPSLRAWTDKLNNAEASAKRGKYNGVALQVQLLVRFLGFMQQEVRK